MAAQPVPTASAGTVSDIKMTSEAEAKPKSTTAAKGAAPGAAKRKRKQDADEGPLKYCSLDDDEALLRAVALVKPGLSRPQWQSVADRVSAKTMNKVSLKRCRSRYQFLVGIPHAIVVGRFGESAMLVKLVQDGQADYVARKEDASAELEPPEEQVQPSLPAAETKTKPKPAKAPRSVAASKSTAAKPQTIPPPPNQMDNSEPRTTTPTELPPAQQPALSSAVTVPAVSASSASDIQSSPMASVGEVPAVNSSGASMVGPSTVLNAQGSAVNHQRTEQTESSLQHQIRELKAITMNLAANFKQTQVENIKLKRDVEVLQKTVRGLNGIKHEVANLRSRLEGCKREVEWIKTHSLMQSLQAQESQKKALERIAIKTTEAENVVEAGKRQLNELLAVCSPQRQAQLQREVESLSNSLTEEIGHIRAVQNENSKAIQAVTEEVSRVQKADSDLFHAFVEAFTGDIVGVRESQEKNRDAIQELMEAHRESEEATRQRQAIFFEMVEAETRGREKLERNIEK